MTIFLEDKVTGLENELDDARRRADILRAALVVATMVTVAVIVTSLWTRPPECAEVVGWVIRELEAA